MTNREESPDTVLSNNEMLKEQLDIAYSDEVINDGEYNKALSEIGYLYAINGLTDDCLLTLVNLKGDYFQGLAIQHFKEDELFFSKCFLMFEVLNFIGHAPYDAFCTQSIAEA